LLSWFEEIINTQEFIDWDSVSRIDGNKSFGVFGRTVLAGMNQPYFDVSIDHYPLIIDLFSY